MASREGAALVIGGTGMLAVATRWLATWSHSVMLVARTADRFAPDDPIIKPVVCDWNSGSFRAVLSGALKAAPPIDRALIWLHEPDAILSWLLPLIPSARVVLVLGSLDGNPAMPAFLNLVTVRLGSIATPTGRRWLTNEEISGGAIKALTEENSNIVGELAPL